MERLIEVDVNERFEKIEIQFSRLGSRSKATTRLNIWDDRWVWIDAREASESGWIWSWTSDGRLAGECSARDLIDAMVETVDLSCHMTQDDICLFDKIWRGHLAKGPDLLR